MEKELYVKITDNADGDTWVLGAVKDGGLSIAKEWIETEIESMSDDEIVSMRYAIGFQMLTEEEVNALPEP